MKRNTIINEECKGNKIKSIMVSDEEEEEGSSSKNGEK